MSDPSLPALIASIVDDDLRARRERLQAQRAAYAGHVQRAQFWRDYWMAREARELAEVQRRRESFRVVS